MNILKIAASFVCLIALAGCLGNTGSEPTLITDPSAVSHLYIANQTGIDLNVTFKTTDSYASIDSTISISAGSTTRIFEPGGFSFPTPSEALANLSFYNTNGNPSSPILIIGPITDGNWNHTLETIKEEKVANYTLVITDEDIN